MMRVKGESGSVVVAVAVLLPLLCGSLGLVLDIGSLYYRNRLIQTAADAGARGWSAAAGNGVRTTNEVAGLPSAGGSGTEIGSPRGCSSR